MIRISRPADDASAIVLEDLHPAQRSLRVAVVTETYPPEVNGVAATIARFVQGLRERNHDIQLVRPRQNRADHPDAAPRYVEVLLNGMSIPRYPNLRMGLPAKRALVRLWTLRRPDLVHVVTEGPLGWSALQAATHLKLPVCSDFRTNFHAYSQHYGIGWLKKPIVTYLRKFHNRTGLTMVPTEALRRDLTDNGFRNVRVVARGVDTRLFDPARRSDALRRSWGAGAETPVVLYVGRLAAEKNLAALTEAFEAIRSRHRQARFVVVGDGPAGVQLRARCPDAVFAGTRSGEALAAHYASGDIFLFPSLTETFGNVTLEAMASGLAVVAYDYAAASEHLVHDVSGLLARYDDTAGFVQGAVELAGDQARIRRLGARAREVALDLEWSRVVQTLETFYLSVLQPSELAANRVALGALGPGASAI